MGSSVTHHNATKRLPLTENKTRICISGTNFCSHAGRARRLAHLITLKYFNQYESWFYFDSADEWYLFLKETFDSVPFPEHLKGHDTSPFIWFETGNVEIKPIGGRSHFAEWALNEFPHDQDIYEIASVNWTCGDIFHNVNGLKSTAK